MRQKQQKQQKRHDFLCAFRILGDVKMRREPLPHATQPLPQCEGNKGTGGSQTLPYENAMVM